jgi:glycosyltransferase involved in cell wall biosynthesis
VTERPPRRPVLQLLVSTKPGGGPQHVATLARGLRARGWPLVVAGPADGVLFDAFRTSGIETVEVATNRLTPAPLFQLLRLVRTRGIALVHSHGKGAGLYGRLVARLSGIPAVHTFHGLHFETYRAVARVGYLALERRLSAWTARIVNVSRAQETEGLALRLFEARQSRVIANGVDIARLGAEALDRDAARVRLALPSGRLIVGTIARFDPVKRLDVLIEATAREPEATLVLVGDGEEAPRLRALAAARRLGSRVVFAGECQDAARLLRAFDVYASASRKEGMPLAILEAMAVGLPIVASDIPAHREVLGATSAGLAPGTVEGFTRALGMLARDAAARLALGEHNRTRACSEFDAVAMVDAVAALYDEVLRATATS